MKRIQRTVPALSLIGLICLAALPVPAAMTTTFAYQGRLLENGLPAHGTYDIRFMLLGEPTSPGPYEQYYGLTNLTVAVSNGAFRVLLDFGVRAFPGADRWLELGIRTNGSVAAYQMLQPRQQVTAAPHAITAGKLADGGAGLTSLNATNVVSGTLSDQRLSDNVALRAGGNTFTGNQIIASGNVGIGTSDPKEKLHVTGDYLRVDGQANEQAYLGGDGAGNDVQIGSLNSGINNLVAFNPTRQERMNLFVNQLEAIGGARVHDQDLYLRTGTDRNHGLGFYMDAAHKPFANASLIDGPVLYGWQGGALGTKSGGEKIALYWNSGGQIGIGTTQPEDLLDVRGNTAFVRIDGGNGLSGLRINESGQRRWILFFRQWQSDNLIVRDEAGGRDTMTFESGTGRVGIGTSTPAATLDVAGNLIADGVESAGAANGVFGFSGSATEGTFSNWRSTGRSAACKRVIGAGNRHAGFGVADGTDIVSPVVWMYGQPGNAFEVRKVDFNQQVPSGVTLFSVTAEGIANVKVLQIHGGADIAEPFPMSETAIPEGSLVVIDQANPGHLKQSYRAYDTRVAGVVSGAGGVQPGIALQQEGIMEGGQHVALSGRVHALADASAGPIQPGDMLTTSNVPGHAMKASDPARAYGAVIGKAMTGLTEGQGLVLVLVNLQ